MLSSNKSVNCQQTLIFFHRILCQSEWLCYNCNILTEHANIERAKGNTSNIGYEKLKDKAAVLTTSHGNEKR